MNGEQLRQSFNRFLKRYYDACKTLYLEMDLPELTNKQFAYLKAIDTHPPVTMGDLAERFNLAKPTVTEFVKKFLDAGLIKRKRSSDDQRVYYLYLTELGQTMAKTNQLESAKMTQILQTELNTEEQIILKSLFDKIGKRYL